MATYRTSLFIFRRDLRIVDNTGLLRASSMSERIIPCFICDPRQLSSANDFRSLNAMQCMHEALESLHTQIQKTGGTLYFFEGKAEDVIKNILAREPIDAIFVNRDYTPFSMKRDEAIEHLCAVHNIDFCPCHDLLLHEPEEIVTGNGTPYSIFTPFFKKARALPVPRPDVQRITNWHTAPIKTAVHTIPSFLAGYHNKRAHVTGNHAEAARILKNIPKYADYVNTHDYPSIETTNASAFLKFGLISIRQFYHTIADTFGLGHALIRQLYWRDFFTHVTYFSPFVFGQPFKDKYKTLTWQNDKKMFVRWCTGTTGFPIIDAGMRQLNATGYMHNRVRLLVGSFLVKDLHIDWRWGEKYFASHLIDYDPALNNGNWQWVASTGTDAQPYFRIFNPWLQQKKFDPQCHYIKKWVPELSKLSPKQIHGWPKYAEQQATTGYPTPCVDHARESSLSKNYYKNTI